MSPTSSTMKKNNDEPRMNLACHYLLWVHRNKTNQNDDKHWLVIIFFGCIETKQNKIMTSIGSSLSSLGAQKQNKTRRQCAPTCHCLLWVHRNKTQKNYDKCWLVIVFLGCTKTKQKNMTTSTNSLLSFFNAQKQNKKRWWRRLACHHLLSMHKNKTKKLAFVTVFYN